MPPLPLHLLKKEESRRLSPNKMVINFGVYSTFRFNRYSFDSTCARKLKTSAVSSFWFCLTKSSAAFVYQQRLSASKEQFCPSKRPKSPGGNNFQVQGTKCCTPEILNNWLDSIPPFHLLSITGKAETIGNIHIFQILSLLQKSCLTYTVKEIFLFISPVLSLG